MSLHEYNPGIRTVTVVVSLADKEAGYSKAPGAAMAQDCLASSWIYLMLAGPR